MRDLFPGLVDIPDEEHEQAWKEGVFSFDANVLLNVFRYTPSVRDELLEILERLNNRIFVSHYAAFEFLRRRPEEVRRQRASLPSAIGRIVESLDQIENQFSTFNSDLKIAAKLPTDLHMMTKKFREDLLLRLNEFSKEETKKHNWTGTRRRLEGILAGKVGPGPTAQADIDQISELGAERYKHGVPPGYKDQQKAVSNEHPSHWDGIRYSREYGDVVIWKQLIQRTKERKSSHVIFVTDDRKEDWWWKTDGEFLGPRPELVHEFIRETGARYFNIYRPDQFLEYAGKYLNIKVAKESIQEAERTSRNASLLSRKEVRKSVFVHDASLKIRRIRHLALLWLQNVFPLGDHVLDNFPDFLVRSDSGVTLGFEVKAITKFRNYPLILRRSAHSSLEKPPITRLDRLVVVLAFEEGFPVTNAVMETLANEIQLNQDLYKSINVIVGQSTKDFVPIGCLDSGGKPCMLQDILQL